jgi:hypothetical protein
VPARTRTEDIQNHKRRAKIFANPLPVSVCVFSENAFCGNFLSFSAKISVFRVRFLVLEFYFCFRICPKISKHAKFAVKGRV